MISKYSHKELIWIDLESYKEEELTHIFEEYSIPEKTKEMVSLKSLEYNIDIDDDFIYISSYFPQILNEDKDTNRIIFIVKNNLVLTVHNKPIEAFSSFSKEMEMDIIQGEKSKINNSNILLSYLLKNLFLKQEEQLIANHLEIKKLEEKIIQKNKRNKFFIISIIILSLIILILCL